MNLRASFCDPFKKDIVEIEDVEENNVMKLFESTPWQDYLTRMANAKENEIYYSPSLEVENKDNLNGITVSIIEGGEWYIFYKRPKLIKKCFGLFERMDNEYLTDIQGQTVQDVKTCLEALLRNDLDFLESKIG